MHLSVLAVGEAMVGGVEGVGQAYSTGGPRANSGPPIKSDRPADQFC